jgi:hypothetical protein
MRFLVRAAVGAAVLAGATAMVPLVPAEAAGDWAVYQAPSVQVDESFFMHKHVDGRRGNWHVLDIRVQQDDDGTLGALTDLRCPRGERPMPDGGDDCTVVGGAEFEDDSAITVTWAPRMRSIHVRGDITLIDSTTADETPATVNLRLRAAGELRREVTRSVEGGTEYKRVELSRGGKITARGHLGWLEATRAQVRNTQPLFVYWVKSRPAV